MGRGQSAQTAAASTEPLVQATGKPPRVLVSVLSHNSTLTTLEALRSLSRQTYPEYHLQLVDNASTDGTTAAVAREFPSLDIKALPSNTGYTGGSNFALRQARDEGYDYVIICTHDVEVEESAVERLVETARSCADAGVAGAVEHNLSDGELRAAGGGSYSKWFSRIVWRGATGDDARQEVFCVHGALVLLTSQALASGVEMDENLFMYFDEADIGFQLRQKKLRAIVDRRVVMRHRGSLRLYAPLTGYLMQRNRLYMVRKHGRWYHQLFYVCFSTLVELPAKILVRSLQGHTGFALACIRGQVDGLLGRMGAPII